MDAIIQNYFSPLRAIELKLKQKQCKRMEAPIEWYGLMNLMVVPFLFLLSIDTEMCLQEVYDTEEWVWESIHLQAIRYDGTLGFPFCSNSCV